MQILQDFHIIHGAVFVALAAFHVWVWSRRGFWLPRYVHVLAAIAFLLGLGSIWWLQQQSLGKPTLNGLLAALMFPTIVYAAFVLYGGAMAADKRNKKPHEQAQPLQQHPLNTDDP